MAASDPTPYVATPTGVLQGVAAFSWDGSAWQPSGRAGPDVATPTGVLQGVAPFSWSGSAWTPAGRAQPGVATPSGVLDGVAVYTWSGSAWTPTGGTATPSTPSGALRGVAAFSWDGAAWQPAGQARPSVPTPYGVLDGVAMFEWGGSSWQAGAAVPAGATLDLSFMSGTLNPSLTFTRASTATYFDVTGTMQTAATNAPRFDYDPVTHAALGLLIEEQRINQAFPSVLATPAWTATSATLGGSVTLPNGTTSTTALIAATDTTNTVRSMNGAFAFVSVSVPCVLSAYLKAGPTANGYFQVNSGTGAATAYFDLTNGVAVVGADLAAGLTAKSVAITPVGNGWYRCSFAFTTMASSTGANPYIGPCTVVSASGDNRSAVGVVGQGVYAWGVQLELGAFPTSLITSTSAAVTRSVDQCGILSAGMSFFTSPGGSWEIEFINSGSGAGVRVIGPRATAGSSAVVFLNASYQIGQFDGGTIPLTVNTTPIGAVAKAATTYTSGTGTVCLNGGAVASAVLSSGYAILTSTGVGFLNTSPGAGEFLTGYLRRVRYWPRVLSNAELQSVTT